MKFSNFGLIYSVLPDFLFQTLTPTFQNWKLWFASYLVQVQLHNTINGFKELRRISELDITAYMSVLTLRGIDLLCIMMGTSLL